MNYMFLVYAHLVTVIPAAIMGGTLLCLKKGTDHHRWVGKVYAALMVITASITLVMPAHVGPQFLNHFGFLHILSLITIISIASALIAIKRGDVTTHQKHMIRLFIGGIVITSVFVLTPGRLIHGLVFS